MDLNRDILRIGPFEVVRKLGTGGMGQVFEAVHPDSGQRCAVKTVHSSGGMGVDALRAIRREVEVLAELDHPHIVKVLDFDLEASRPWFAMEFIDGRPFSDWNSDSSGEPSTADTIVDIASRTTMEDWSSLRDALGDARAQMERIAARRPARLLKMAAADSWHPGPELRTKLAWVGQVARALQFLHGLNIIHGDVKPDNVLIRSDGVAVLVDFGLVSKKERRISHATIARSLTRAQTLEYAAPERHLAADYDARADLYALGCMLYEVFAGTPPFTGPASAVAIAHVVQDPPHIKNVDEPPPKRMWELIEDLLEKDPRRRVAYSAHICAVLESLSVATTPGGRSLPATRPYLYQPGFVGLKDELETARAVLNSSSIDSPRLVQVIGGEGAGKSRFLLEVAGEAVQTTGHVHFLSADSSGSERLPFASMRFVFEHLVDLCRTKAWRPNADAFWIARVEPRLAPFLSESDRALLAEVATVPRQAAHKAISVAVVGALRSIADKKLIVILVESLDALEEGSRAIIDEVLRRAKSERWLVVATASTKVVSEHETVAIELPALAPPEVSEFASQIMGGASLDDETVELLATASQGRPAALVDLMNTLLENELIEQDDWGAWHGANGTDLESAVREMIRTEAARPERRIARLRAPVRRVAEVCAVLGRSLNLADVFDLMSTSRGEISLAVSELIGARVLAEGQFGDASSPRDLAFVSRKLREALYRAIPEERRQMLHLAAAEVVGRRGDLSELAQHLERGGDSENAYVAYRDAADAAVENYAQDLRVKCLEGALRVGMDAPQAERESILYQRYQGICDYASTDVVASESESVLRVVELATTRARILYTLFSRLLSDSRSEQVAGHLDEVRAMTNHENPSVSVPANSALAIWHNFYDQIDDAVASGQAAVKAAEGANASLRLQAIVSYGNALFRTDRVDECVATSELAVEIARETGEQHKVQTAIGRVVAIRAKQGHFAAVERALEPVAAFQFRARMLSGYVISMWNIGYAAHAIGRFDKALETLDKIDEVCDSLGVERDIGEYLSRRSAALAILGDHAESRRFAEESIQLAKRAQVRVHANLQYCEALQASGAYAESLEHLDDLDPAAGDVWAPIWSYLCASAAIELGQYERAERELHATRQRNLAPHEEAHLRHLEGRFAWKRGDVSRAFDLFEQALDWFERHEFAYDSSLTRLDLAHCLAALGRDIPESLVEPVRAYVDTQPFAPESRVRSQLAEVEALLGSNH